MSEIRCPRCHSETESDAQGRCAACGQCLSVSPLHLDADVKRRALHWIWQPLLATAFLGGLILVIEAVLRADRGSILIAIYQSIGLILVPTIIVARSNLQSFPTESPPQPSALPRSVTFVIVGLILYLGIRLWIVQSTAAAVTGTNTTGHYRNDYFNFQLAYAPDWHVVPEATGKQAAASNGVLYKLIGLTLSGTNENSSATGFLITAVHIPKEAPEYTSSEHLDMMVSSLMKRLNHTQDLKTERPSRISEIDFDRQSLKMPAGDDLIGVTFWAARKRDHIIVITGSYQTSEGLLAIEELLAKMIEVDQR